MAAESHIQSMVAKAGGKRGKADGIVNQAWLLVTARGGLHGV